MSYAIFMLTLLIFLVLTGIDMFLDEKFDINDRFIYWLVDKVEKRMEL